MKLGTVLGYSGADMSLPIDRVLEAERLGFGSVSAKRESGFLGLTSAFTGSGHNAVNA
jgi:hypothetical protein